MASSTDTERHIALVRHGMPAHVRTGWVSLSGLQKWREGYDAAGIRADEIVPPHVQALMARGPLVVSSDTPRAAASARLLRPEADVVMSPLLRELDLEAPPLPGLRLPLRAWAVAIAARALFEAVTRGYPSAAETARIREAAAWLDQLSKQHPAIVAVTHAQFRRELARRLVHTGWAPEPGDRSGRHWSAWVLRRNKYYYGSSTPRSAS